MNPASSARNCTCAELLISKHPIVNPMNKPVCGPLPLNRLPLIARKAALFITLIQPLSYSSFVICWPCFNKETDSRGNGDKEMLSHRVFWSSPWSSLHLRHPWLSSFTVPEKSQGFISQPYSLRNEINECVCVRRNGDWRDLVLGNEAKLYRKVFHSNAIYFK